jgi:hypothetical protein
MFEKSVFINCSFDQNFKPLMNCIIFTILDMGFSPRSALEEGDGSVIRLSKIYKIVSECKFGIHDLSCTELDPINNLPRFNMPLELGIDLASKQFGSEKMQEKVLLILDSERYRYQKFISDIAGQDIKAHNLDRECLIKIVRNWLSPEIDGTYIKIPSGKKINNRFSDFLTDYPDIIQKIDSTHEDIEYLDFCSIVSKWIVEHPID